MQKFWDNVLIYSGDVPSNPRLCPEPSLRYTLNPLIPPPLCQFYSVGSRQLSCSQLCSNNIIIAILGMTCNYWHQVRIDPVTSSYRVNMGHKDLLMQFAIIALIICSSCGVRRYKYGSRIRSLAERRNFRQPKDYYSANSILRSNSKMKNIYEQGKSKYYKYSKRFRWVRRTRYDLGSILNVTFF